MHTRILEEEYQSDIGNRSISKKTLTLNYMDKLSVESSRKLDKVRYLSIWWSEKQICN